MSGLKFHTDGTWHAVGHGGNGLVFPPPTLLTSVGYLFAGWSWMDTFPAIDTSAATDFQYMFSGCTALTSVPALDTSAVTSMSYMFTGCTSLTTVGPLDASAVTTPLSGMYSGNAFDGCTSLTSLVLNGLTQTVDLTATAMGKTALNAFFTGLGTASSGATVTITGTPGAATCDQSIATAKGWTVVA